MGDECDRRPAGRGHPPGEPRARRSTQPGVRTATGKYLFFLDSDDDSPVDAMREWSRRYWSRAPISSAAWRGNSRRSDSGTRRCIGRRSDVIASARICSSNVTCCTTTSPARSCSAGDSGTGTSSSFRRVSCSRTSNWSHERIAQPGRSISSSTPTYLWRDREPGGIVDHPGSNSCRKHDRSVCGARPGRHVPTRPRSHQRVGSAWREGLLDGRSDLLPPDRGGRPQLRRGVQGVRRGAGAHGLPDRDYEGQRRSID